MCLEQQLCSEDVVGGNVLGTTATANCSEL